jgi:hypothetical protein
MQFSGTFRLDGAPVSARVDLTLSNSTISTHCMQRSSWTPEQVMQIAVPFGSGQFTCALRLQPGVHEEDLVVGKDWSAQFCRAASTLDRLQSSSRNSKLLAKPIIFPDRHYKQAHGPIIRAPLMKQLSPLYQHPELPRSAPRTPSAQHFSWLSVTLAFPKSQPTCPARCYRFVS